MQKICCVVIVLLGCNITLIAQKKWSLSACIAHAEKNNLVIKNKKIEGEIKEISITQAQKSRLPDMNGYVNAYSNFGQSQDVFGNTQRNDNLNNSMGVASQFTIYNNGKLKNQVARSKVDLKLAEYDIRIENRNLVIDIIQEYLNVLLNREVVSMMDGAVAYAGNQYEKASVTTKAGSTALTVQYEAQANLAREKQKLESAKIDVKRSLMQLGQLLQLNDYTDFEIQNEEVDELKINMLMMSRQQLLEQSYRIQPSLLKYDELIKGLDYDEKLLRVQYYPTVSGRATLGTTNFSAIGAGQHFNFFRQTKENFAQQISLTINIPIYNKEKTNLQIRQNGFVKSQMLNQQNLEKQNIRIEVENAYFDWLSNYQKYLAAKEVVNSSKIALAYTEKSYEAGRSTIYDLNNSRNNYLQSQSDLISSKYSCYYHQKLLKYYVSETVE
jgi:outer membrane protein